jgi:carboxyl-terminal processing protease
MKKSPVFVMSVVLVVLCLNGLSFLAGLGVGRFWSPHSQAEERAVAGSPSPAFKLSRKETNREEMEQPERAPTANPSPRTSPSDNSEEDVFSLRGKLALIHQVWEIVEREFYHPEGVDREAVAYSAIRGLLEGLDDPHTSFFEPSRHEINKSNYEGKFGGIGAFISITEEGDPTIASVIDDTPADRAGLQANDIIVEVDGKSLEGLTQDEIVLLIRGPIGSVVNLTVRRPGEAELLSFAVPRAEIEQPTVNWEAVDKGQVAHLRLTFFAGPTGDELAKALAEITDQGIDQIALDLRGNRGGLLTSSGQVVAQLVQNDVLLYERRRGADGDVIEEAYMIPDSDGPVYKDLDLVVLVDGGTASAAEIVAGAIQDYERALLVGQQTFGKGSMQYVHVLEDNSSLHVTAAHWLTPNRQKINGKGLTPDIIVEQTEAKGDEDLILKQSLQVLRERR